MRAAAGRGAERFSWRGATASRAATRATSPQTESVGTAAPSVTGHYSRRSALIGSTRVARQVGTPAAAAAASASSSGARVKAAGSSGPMP